MRRHVQINVQLRVPCGGLDRRFVRVDRDWKNVWVSRITSSSSTPSVHNQRVINESIFGLFTNPFTRDGTGLSCSRLKKFMFRPSGCPDMIGRDRTNALSDPKV